MLREASLGLAGVVIIAYVIEFLVSHLDDPREPRRVPPRIPVIGHILGFLRHGFDYYNLASQNTDAEIYTVGIMNLKVYVTHATRLTHMIQRSKTLSFGPFLQLSSKVHGNVSDEAHALFNGDLLEDFSLRTREALAPGPHLDAQNLRMADQSLIEVTDMLKQGEIQLLEWARHAVVQATGAGLYGVQHPFKDPEIEDAMWIWDEHRPGHMIGIDPLGKGYNARAKVFETFREYFQNMPDDVSLIIRQRQKILRDGGICEEDAYKMQSTLSDAAYPNTVPTLFWTVYEIYSRPELLEAIRQEIFSKAVRKSDEGFILDVAALKTECHILLSAYQETQRTRHSQVAFRMVVEDTLLDGQYLLKKGNYLHMPAKPIHENPKIWGPQASVFDPYRFVPAVAGESRAKILPSSFLPWGAPPHMCPARQFASTEILIITALLALRVNLTPASAKGWEREPAVKSMDIPTLPRPRKDVRLKVTAREEGAGIWAIIIGESKTRVSLASG
ncbi:Uncharacterized protein BP5553_05687 [Venustampulla echinocandica]|uniref:Cytochrome P450 n=1 Tax=Venustampulla echinocandica TaxID=2656787 RepID=A0A370TLE4_9HELO|nr:Uncharacterized protein BP5553_05687 [Venustampulla echinocandica]RDL36335.1 Uncharacterized protein BP5553_05687 [Venustampulla echinocandica]